MTSDSKDANEVRTVGPREGLGAGIVALGILSIFLPGVVDQLPSVASGGSPAFVLAGMSIVIGIFVALAGILSFVIKD